MANCTRLHNIDKSQIDRHAGTLSLARFHYHHVVCRGRFGSKQARLRHLCVYAIVMFFLMYSLPSLVVICVPYRFSATPETSGSGGEALLGKRVLHFGLGALQSSFMAFVVVGADFLDFFFEQCFNFSLRTTRMMCSSSRLRHLCI